MPRIENVSYADILKGNYQNDPSKTVLIQITDVDGQVPVPPDTFFDGIVFSFADLTDAGENNINASVMFNESQAQSIATVLKGALDIGMNVTVHCVAGLSRSGAVAEVGEMMGFEYIGRTKIPNVHVKSLLLKELGLSYY